MRLMQAGNRLAQSGVAAMVLDLVANCAEEGRAPSLRWIP